MKTKLLLLCVLGTGLICCFDNVMTVIYSETIFEMEQNPIGSFLLAKGGVRLFVEVKALTTIAAIALMIGLIKTKYRMLIPAVFGAKLIFFFYLTFLPNIRITNGFGQIKYDLVSAINNWHKDSDETSPVYEFVSFYSGRKYEEQ